MKSLWKTAALAMALLAPSAALAETDAVVTTDLNVRTGPGAGYQRYGTIPAGDTVTVYGCLRGYNWCDIDWSGGRGWVSGNYLAYLGRRYYREPISTVGISIGVPVIGYEPYSYHRRYYVGAPWYHDRYLDWRDWQDDDRQRYDGGFRRIPGDRIDPRRELREERRAIIEERRDNVRGYREFRADRGRWNDRRDGGFGEDDGDDDLPDTGFPPPPRIIQPLD